MTHLLRTDAEHHVAVLARDVHVPRLELVLQRDGDLAVLTAEHLLQLARVHRGGLGRGGLELEPLLVEVQLVLLFRWWWSVVGQRMGVPPVTATRAPDT